MRRNKLIIIAITILLLSCNSKKGNFSAIAPQGWLLFDTTSKNNGKFVKMRPPVKSDVPIFVENINIGIMHFPSLNLYITNVIATVKEKAFYFEEKGKGTIKINQYNITWEQYILQQDKNSYTVEQKVYFIWDEGNIYQIVCSAKENEIKIIQNKIDEVLKTFKIL